METPAKRRTRTGPTFHKVATGPAIFAITNNDHRTSKSKRFLCVRSRARWMILVVSWFVGGSTMILLLSLERPTIPKNNNNIPIAKKDFGILPRKTTINNTSSSKFYVLHVGPAKTGSTTLQMDSGRNTGFQKALALDGVRYMGKESEGYHGSFRKHAPIQKIKNCLKTVYRWNHFRSMSNTTKTSMHNELVNCWTIHNQNNFTSLWKHSIIDSYENYNLSKKSLKELVITLKDYLDYDEVFVVGAYRRYYEWLASSYRQYEGLHSVCQGIETKTATPNRSHCATIGEYIREHLATPDFASHSSNLRLWNLDRILQAASNEKGVTVRILNYFQHQQQPLEYNSITEEFYCQALGMDRTPHTCNYATQRNRSEIERFNVRSLSSKDTTTVQNRIRTKLAGLNWTTGTKQYPPSQESILQVATKIVRAQQKTNQPAFQECLSDSEKQVLLEKSLRFEALVMPEFHETPQGREAHIAGFWKQANKYCWFDAEGLFEGMDSWDQLVHEKILGLETK